MPLDRIKQLIHDSNNILLVSHIDSDGDSLGSAIALQSGLSAIGKQVFVPAPTKFHHRYSLLNKYTNGWGYVPQKPNIIIAIDCSSEDRIDWGGFLNSNEVPLINIDHHDGNPAFGDVNWLDPNAAAAGEMVYELLKKLPAPIDEHAASALYIAIMSDTGRFSFGNTTSKTLAIAAALVELGADPKYLTTETYFNFSEEYFRNIGIALFNSRSYNNGRILFLTLDRATTQNFLTSPEDSEGIIDFAMAVHNVDVAVLFKEFSRKNIRVSMRSRRGIDIDDVAKYFGGGGHPNAAGCSIEATLTTAQQGVLNRIQKLLGIL